MNTSGSTPAQPKHNWCQIPPASKRSWGGKGSTEAVPTMPPIWKTQRRHPLTSLVTRGTPKCQKWSFSSPLYTTFPKRAMLPVLHSPFPGLVSAEGEKNGNIWNRLNSNIQWLETNNNYNNRNEDRREVELNKQLRKNVKKVSQEGSKKSRRKKWKRERKKIKNGKQKSEEWKEKKGRKGKKQTKRRMEKEGGSKNKGSTTYKIHK